jgi:hypothetical protein
LLETQDVRVDGESLEGGRLVATVATTSLGGEDFDSTSLELIKELRIHKEFLSISFMFI